MSSRGKCLDSISRIPAFAYQRCPELNMVNDRKPAGLPDPSAESKYRQFLEIVGAEIDRRYPGVFEWRFGQPSKNVVDGLIITKAEREGYVFVVGSCRLPGSVQGGVWRDGAEHTYGASILDRREWEQPSTSHWEAIYLESRCSSESAEIVNWIANDWAFERPWVAPAPIDEQAERKRLEKIVLGLRSRPDVDVIVNAKPNREHCLTKEGKAALARDLDGLLIERIRNSFPPDKRGNLTLGTSVLLACYETTSPPARDRKLCLTAVGPHRRSDPHEIHITLAALIPVNQDHCWQHERWNWHFDSANADSATKWGSPVPIEALASGTLSTPKLLKKIEKGVANDSDRNALAILLQDAGRLLENVVDQNSSFSYFQGSTTFARQA